MTRQTTRFATKVSGAMTSTILNGEPSVRSGTTLQGESIGKAPNYATFFSS